MEITGTYFTGSHDLPSSTLAFATVRDSKLVFVWNLHAVRTAVMAEEWDGVFETANMIIQEALDANTPPAVRLAS